MPFLSIIVPIYNGERYVNECIDSILTQTFEDFELILVNDGSTDTTSNICDDYAEHDARIIVIHKENDGLVSARKAGLRAANGKYVGFVDSDDWIEADMYQVLCDAARDYAVDIVICDIVENYPDQEVRCAQIIPPGLYDKERMEKEVYPMMLYAGQYYKFGLFPSVSNKVFKKSLIQKCQYNVDDKIRIGEDVACTYPSLLDANSIYLLDNQYLYHYRQNPSSMTASYDRNFFEQMLILYEQLKYVARSNAKRVPHFTHQLQYYVVYLMMAGVNNELNRHNDKSLREKRAFIRKMIKHKDMNDALQVICTKELPFKTKIYIWLLKKQYILLLYALIKIKRSSSEQ